MRTLTYEDTQLIHGGFFEAFVVDAGVKGADILTKVVLFIIAVAVLGYGVSRLI